MCTAFGGLGNPAIASRVFNAVANSTDVEMCVVVMWSFLSRYDWAMPRHKDLEDTRWATISPWDTDMAARKEHQSTGRIRSTAGTLETKAENIQRNRRETFR